MSAGVVAAHADRFIRMAHLCSLGAHLPYFGTHLPYFGRNVRSLGAHLRYFGGEGLAPMGAMGAPSSVGASPPWQWGQ